MKSSLLIKLILFVVLLLVTNGAQAHAVVYAYNWNGAVNATSDYFLLGIKHIIPLGYDHILFMIGLFLSEKNIKKILWMATAFTVAHTVTLILCAVKILPSHPEIIEPVIGLSIAAIGLENLVSGNRNKVNYILVFIFGLIHGCGFATALSESGIPEQFFFSSLISFNLGIEFAQVFIILTCFLIVRLFEGNINYRRYVVIPVSIFIFISGIIMMSERLGAKI